MAMVDRFVNKLLKLFPSFFVVTKAILIMNLKILLLFLMVLKKLYETIESINIGRMWYDQNLC